MDRLSTEILLNCFRRSIQIVFTDESGTYEGEFLNDYFHGEYIFTDLEGKKFIDKYENSEFISSKPYTE